jgi:hypothetical protein
MSPTIHQDLKSLVERHTIRYEAWPHWEMHEGERVMIGFDLELHGTHDHGHSQLTPGCKICRQTYEDLKRVATEVLPKEERASWYEVEPFDHGLHSEGRGPMEVVLIIRIEHRRDYFAPVDACEERCLAQIEAGLKQLGVPGRRRRK